MSHSAWERVTGEARGRGQGYSEALLLVMLLGLLNLPQKPSPGWYPFGLPSHDTESPANRPVGKPAMQRAFSLTLELCLGMALLDNQCAVSLDYACC